MKRLLSKRRTHHSYHKFLLFIGLSLFTTIFLNCSKAEKDPAKILTKFFHLINEGSYKKAAVLTVTDTDPYLLNFTNVVPLRFINKVIVKKGETYKDSLTFNVFLILKDGKELVYYTRTKQGEFLPGRMQLKKVELKNNREEWRVECNEFWESYHWQDITRKIRLNIIMLTEKIIQYRDSTQQLPASLTTIWSDSLETIINPVTGRESAFVTHENIMPGATSFFYDKERDEVDIKGYDALGEQMDYFIVSRSQEIDKAKFLEFYDVPPITITSVIPAYPETEREKGIEGNVSLKLLIGRDGMVHDVRIEKHLSPTFDSVAVDAVMHSVFSPAKSDGRPVAIWYYFPVRFVLEK